jgi:anti-anti-sigma regulatory factor
VFAKTASIRLPANLVIDDIDEIQALLAPAEWADEAIVDFSELPAISATVLGALLALVNGMAARNRLGVVRIVGANPRILRIFKLCRADSLFDLSRAEAVAPLTIERIYAN